MLLLEVKGYDPLAEMKRAGALAWVSAVNGAGRHGRWHFEMVHKPSDVTDAIERAMARGA